PSSHKKVILIVDETVAGAISNELLMLKTNLVGDGWAVVRTNVPRHDDLVWSNNTNAIASIKGFLPATYTAATNTQVAFLIGHVPIPYMGCADPDHHETRALPADGYYGDFDGVYHDTTANCRVDGISDSETRHNNVPGDGKWDESSFPGEIKIAI